MTTLVPGVMVLALYGGVMLTVRRVQLAKAKHVDRLTILQEFEREINRQR